MRSPNVSDFQRLAPSSTGRFTSTPRCGSSTRRTHPYIARCRKLSRCPDRGGHSQTRSVRTRPRHIAYPEDGGDFAGRTSRRGRVSLSTCRVILLRVLKVDAAQRRVRVQPGVVRNELNLALAPHGVFFAPETSTQNRCMIGGMVGNNACGANSVVYGSTREHLVSARAILSDGSIAEFGPMSAEEFEAKCAGDSLKLRSIARRNAARRCREPRRDRARVPEEIHPPPQHGLCDRLARRLRPIHARRASVQLLPPAGRLRGDPGIFD